MLSKVVAHRGYWKAEGSAQKLDNGIRKADAINAFGSEIDVLQTKDGVLVVNHDAHVGPDKNPYRRSGLQTDKDIKLSNGEPCQR